jgi:O-antigen ligase
MSIKDYFRFENPGLLSLSILFIAFSFNDFWSINFGLPTPIQVAILWGIYYNFKKSCTKTNNSYWLLLVSMSCYLIMYLTITVIDFDINPNFYVVSIIFNSLFLFSLLPFLASGCVQSDWNKLVIIIQVVVSVISVPPAMYELITHQNFITAQTGLAENVFYLRGLHLDKLEFGSIMALGSFISIIQFFNTENTQKYRNFSVLLFSVCTLLLAFSYSTTSIMGFVTGLTLILFFVNKKILWYMPIFLLFGWLAKDIVMQTSLFAEQQANYELKYKLNVEMADERNFRKIAIEKSLLAFEKEPWLGYGIEKNAEVTQKLMLSDKPVNSHNIFANELVNMGILGFAPLLCYVLFLYFFSFQSSKNTPQYVRDIGLIAKAIGIFTAFRFILYYHRFDQTFYGIWAALVVLFIGTIYMHRTNKI